MTRSIASVLFAIAIFPIAAPGQTVANYPGAGVIQAGDVWESFLPQGTTPSYTEAATAATLGIRTLVRMGNFDRGWTTPASNFPSAFPMTPYWLKDAWVLIYDPDTTWNRGFAGPNPSFFQISAANGGTANYSNFANLTYRSTLNGAADPTRKYSIDPYWVDGTERQHVVYEAGWPTNLGVDVKLRAHGFAAPNWDNLNDYVIVEIQLKNTGFLDMNMDGIADNGITNHDIKALAFQIEEQSYMSVSSYACGGRCVNDIVPSAYARQAAWVDDPDSSNAPWAFSMVFPSATTLYPTPGNVDIGFNGGTTKNYMDLKHGWVMLDVKDGGLPSDRSQSTSGLPSKPTLFGSHPIGTGTQRGWFVSGGSSYWAGSIGDPRKMFYITTGVWYANGGQLSHNTDFTQLNLAPNSNFFSAGNAGDPLSFVTRISPARPNGDYKSTNHFDQASFEDGHADAVSYYPTGWGKWTLGCSHTENFDYDMFTGVGPFALKKDSSMTLVFATVAGYRLEGIERSVRAARWCYENNFQIPKPPPLPEMKASITLNSSIALEWDNGAETDAQFAGYKIWKSSQSKRLSWLDEGMRVVDRYEQQMTVGPRPAGLYKPVNPKFDAFAKTLANATGGTYQPDTWGTWDLVKVIPKSELPGVTPATSPGYTYRFEDQSVLTGFQYWYYISAYKEGTYTGPAGDVTSRIETHSTNRNGATGLWNLTYPFGFNNVNYPNDAAGLKNIGAGVVMRPLLANTWLDFGLVNIGSSRTLDVKIANSASDPLLVSVMSTQGRFVPSPSSIVIGPASDSTIVIRFTPTKTGPDSAFVILTTNGTPGNDTISVRGAGGAGLQRGVVAWIGYPDTMTAGQASGPYTAIDASGNIYAADMSVSYGVSKITKFDPSGAVLWSLKESGYGTGLPALIGVQVDPQGYLYLVTTGTPDPPAQYYDFGISKYLPTGELLWRRSYNPHPGGQSGPTAFVVDRSGNLLATGSSRSSSSSTNTHITTIKFDGNGNLQWSVDFDGPPLAYDSSNTGRGIAVDSAGNVYVIGTTRLYTSSNIVALKYNQAGIQQWAAYYNGPKDSMDIGSDIGVDGSGDVYVLGTSSGVGTGMDIAVVKYRGTDGMPLWVDRYDGPAHANDGANKMLVSKGQMIYVSGSAIGPQSTSSGVVLRYSPGGSRSMALQYEGPTGFAYGGMLSEDRSGFLYVGASCLGELGYTEGLVFKVDTSSSGIEWESSCTDNPATATTPVCMSTDAAGDIFVSGYSTLATTGRVRCFVAKYGQVASPITEDPQRLPVTDELFQNYPNPFNPSTTIRFGLVHTSYVSLVVFNSLGQEVATLVRGDQDPGYHQVRFDARNLASGVYFYRLQAGSFLQTKKLLILK